jgi:tripartite-type tricarboxylate transporter receptor subunit TctC
MLAPAGTPKEIVQKLNAKLVEIAKSEEMIAKMRAINVIVPPQTPEEVRAYLVEDTKRNAELIKAANIKLE